MSNDKTHSEKLRDSLKTLLASELGIYKMITAEGAEFNDSPSIRIIPPQVPDYIKMEVVDGRGIECLVYQDPRVETSSMQADFEYYQIIIRQHNLKQPTSKARKLITNVFSAVKMLRRQQEKAVGEIKLEQINLEIPRYYNFDSDYISRKIEKINLQFS